MTKLKFYKGKLKKNGAGEEVHILNTLYFWQQGFANDNKI